MADRVIEIASLHFPLAKNAFQLMNGMLDFGDIRMFGMKATRQ